MRVYYFWDAYCGWCYGFEKILTPFLEMHSELDVQFISGGLFNQGNPIKKYPHIREANQRIQEIFGVEFSQDYNQLLQDGSLILDSNDAAIGFGVLRDFVSKKDWIYLAKAIQIAFYQQGQSLSDVNTYRTIAKQFLLETEEIERQFLAKKQTGKIHEDIQQTQAWQIPSFPTLIAEVDGKFYDLKGNATTETGLEKNYQRLLEYLLEVR